eukprot:GHVU01009814.1.p1 GENE.GHVU01009814.1~~GHVU01009814.1.p1  ORF type:complete len:184 (-),score=43.89 GHVU01009814.1:2115-2666(-)
MKQEFDKLMSMHEEKSAEVHTGAKQLEDVQCENKKLKRELKSVQDELRKKDRAHENLNKKLESTATSKADIQTELSAAPTNQNMEARLTRLVDELERCKAQAAEKKTTEKQRDATDKQEAQKLKAEVGKLERQRAELINGFKIQQQLIDVLQRQKAHLETAALLNFTEEEFMKILESSEAGAR